MGKEPLYKKIIDFEQFRELWIFPLIVFGLFGLLIPVIPGLLILYLALVLFDPDTADKVKDFFSDFWKVLKR